ncbi:MAG: VOC family protein [Acidobacteria bacterium]|nr:VOC family protein [Acidobacteriota bacterium]
MKVHISLNVKDIKKSTAFYEKMLGIKPLKFIVPERVENAKKGYAKFDVADPPLNLTLNEGSFDAGGSLSHLGLQVASTEDVLKFKQNWIEAGLLTVDEFGVDCCYANQDKTWVRDPDGNEWEAFVVLGDLAPETSDASCACSNQVAAYVESSSTAAESAECCTASAGESKGSGCC